MRLIRAAATANTPKVVFNMTGNSLVIEGECYPENPKEFFAPFLRMLNNHFETNKVGAFEVRFNLRYLNTTATKALQNILAILESQAGAGTAVDVYWSYDPEDDALEEIGHDLLDDFSDLRAHCMAMAPQKTQ